MSQRVSETRIFPTIFLGFAILAACWSQGCSSDKETLPSGDTVQVYLGLKRQTEVLENFVARVSDPTNQETYGKYLSVNDVAKKLGVTESTKSKVIAYLSDMGVAESYVNLDPIGSTYVAEMAKKVAGSTFCYDPTDESTCIPDPLKDVVTEVMIVTPVGNEDGGSAAHEPSLMSDRGNHGTPEGCKEGVNTGAYTPNQYRTAYGVDPLWEKDLTGKGVRVAIINSCHWEKEDIATFTSCFNLGGCIRSF